MVPGTRTNSGQPPSPCCAAALNLHLRLRCLINAEVRRVIVEPQQRGEPQVAVDGVDVERRQRNAVGIGQPRPLARSLTSRAANVRAPVARPRLLQGRVSRPVETDAGRLRPSPA